MKKERVLNLIKNVLIHEGRVVFVYAHGSFVGGKSFRDIDIGVYDNIFIRTLMISITSLLIP
ncbi:MAG: hypothetical protein A2V86_05700 [Deltaproteobacteria bacterium RBG_16_49_23]|nr:MAG: hypothetical protein A2V86_05700 [Deltaproteobacteria bacterium RBG_16_49_23]